MTELLAAKLFEGELWIKASDHQKVIKEALAQPEQEQIAVWLEKECDEQYLADRVRAGDYTKEKGRTENCAALADDICKHHLSPSLVGVGEKDYTAQPQHVDANDTSQERVDENAKQHQEQEPVAFETWYENSIWGNEDFKTGCKRAWKAAIEHYAPPQRTWEKPWVSLTDNEIDQGLLRSDYAFKTAEAWRAGVVFAMTKLQEKNT